jgi:hypothetical protein
MKRNLETRLAKLEAVATETAGNVEAFRIVAFPQARATPGELRGLYLGSQMVESSYRPRNERETEGELIERVKAEARSAGVVALLLEKRDYMPTGESDGAPNLRQVQFH